MKRIFLLEDDQTLGSVLKERIGNHYDVTWKQTQKESLEFLKDNRVDLLILDLGLPDGSGFQVAEWNFNHSHIPTVFLTAQSDAESRLRGYELGAQEFIPKPFHLKELLIRIQHVLQSHSSRLNYKLSSCEIDFTDGRVIRSDGSIEYPAGTDLKVLQLLIERAPEAVTRDQMLDYVWGPDKEINYRTIDNTIVRLKKLISDNGEECIRSVRGVGYQWIHIKKEK